MTTRVFSRVFHSAIDNPVASPAPKIPNVEIATKLRTISTSTGTPSPWFQLYVHRDRGLTKALVERAYAAGYAALCLTVDAPVLGQRERDRQNHFALPINMELANLASLTKPDLPRRSQESGLFAYFLEQINPALTWNDLEWLQSLSPLPLVLKGILRSDDAVRACH